MPSFIRALTISFIPLALSSSTALATIDNELRESRKCSGMFAYYEKKYKLPANSLHAISLQESAKKHSRHDIAVVWPWTVMDNKEGKSYHFPNQTEAIKYVRKQFAYGNNNLDVGCMQINLKHHPEAFSSLAQAFSPSSNINYAAFFLSENVKKLGSIDKAIGRYHSATDHLADRYKSNVSRINQKMAAYKVSLNNITKAENKIATPKPNKVAAKSYEMLYMNASQNRNSKVVVRKAPVIARKTALVSKKLPASQWFRKK